MFTAYKKSSQPRICFAWDREGQRSIVEVIKDKSESVDLKKLNFKNFLTKFEDWKKAGSPQEKTSIFGELRNMHQSAGINKASTIFGADEEMLAFGNYIQNVEKLRVDAALAAATVKPAIVAPTSAPTLVTPAVITTAPTAPTQSPVAPVVPVAPATAPVPTKPEKPVRTLEQIKNGNSKFIEKHREVIDYVLKSYTDESQKILNGYLDDPTKENIKKFQKAILLESQDGDFRNNTLSVFKEDIDLDTTLPSTLQELKKINGLEGIDWDDILAGFGFKLNIVNGNRDIHLPKGLVWVKPQDGNDFSLKLEQGYVVLDGKIVKRVTTTKQPDKALPENEAQLKDRVLATTISDFNKYISDTPVLKDRIKQIPDLAKWTDTKDNDFSFYIGIDKTSGNPSIHHEVKRSFFTSNKLSEFENQLITQLQVFLDRNVKNITGNPLKANVTI